jgi:magnesium transporter
MGAVPLRRLVTSSAGTRLESIVEPVTVVVHASDDQESVLQTIRKYSAMEAAVVDDQERLVGRITHDDVLDVADEEAAEDLLRVAGTDASELATSSVFQAARIRMTWLLPCMLGMILSASVLGMSRPRFDPILFGALSLFVPMIGATGGNSGIQISTVIIRGFASGDLGATKLLRVFFREGRIALAMAPICGFVAWAAVSASLPILESFSADAAQFHSAARVALAVGLAMTAAILLAACLGIALPFSFRRLGVDPAIASGPLVTTLNDVVSVTIYMTTAMIIAR